MNIRNYLDFNNGYYSINREERNLAAIFYNLLLQTDNLKRFLDTISCQFPINNKEMAIYFEYAFLRDIWFNIDKPGIEIERKNLIKRNTIIEFLKPLNRSELSKMSVLEFNKYFGAVPRPSTTDIQSPGNWSIRFYDKNIEDHNEFLKVCKFKWCFNAKPDIVIHTTNDTAICIEAKLESNEGKYPSNEKEKEIFKRRELELVGQLFIQKMIMDELLGLQTKYIFLVQKRTPTDTHDTYTWKDIFSKLDKSNCPRFVSEWINRADLNRD